MAWSLSSIVTFLQTFVVDTSVTQANVIDFIRLRYERIFNEFLKYYKVEETFATVSGTRYYYLPRTLSLVHGVKLFNQSNPNSQIKGTDWSRILTADPDQDQSGTPEYVALVETSPVERQPTEASEISTFLIRSSDNDDVNTVTISRKARSGSRDFETTEQITLTGTTNVSTVNTWVYIRQFSKHGNSEGHILMFDSSNTNLYAIIDPYESQSEYQKIRLWPTPDSADTIRALGYRRPIIPQTASGRLDVPQALEASFIDGLRADVHRINFDFIMANHYDSKFEDGLQRYKEKIILSSDEVITEGQEEEDFNPLKELGEISENTEV